MFPLTRTLLAIVAMLAMPVSLAGCFGPQPVLASSEVTRDAVNRESPPADRARVFVFAGQAPLFSSGAGPLRSHILPADIYIDGVKIGTVNPKEAMVFDIRPGRYTFTWMIYNQRVGWGEEMRPSVFNLPGGRTTTISADYYITTYFLTEGAAASLFDKDQRRLAPDVTVVRPVHCPPTLCL